MQSLGIALWIKSRNRVATVSIRTIDSESIYISFIYLLPTYVYNIMYL